ncbi:hypothetical protein GC093_04705 [Paenibacillus sp. LMG 31456]|uniref:Uncharacterized protein n=1 Tax=Paenibacillus foliorum TaxID=2654974 RepID=A0A972GTN1_9BACL|nr:hypothetical protein [Paenibacillus foliorum]NOU92535.1 hypothetical protein [Paenibacillus foliorum]
MTNDNQQVAPMYKQISNHHLPYYDSVCYTLQPYPYTYQYNGYRYLNPHVYHLPLIYQQYAYHPHLREQLYPYRMGLLTPPGAMLPAAEASTFLKAAIAWATTIPAVTVFLGFGAFLLAAMVATGWAKYKDTILTCWYSSPAQWGEIETCLKGKMDAADAERWINTMKTLFGYYMKTKHLPNPCGVWAVTVGNRKVGTLRFHSEYNYAEGVDEYMGHYNWAPTGTMYGHALSSEGNLSGHWNDLHKIGDKPDSGRYKLNFSYDESGNSIFIGTFGYGTDDSAYKFSGIQLSEEPCLLGPH